MLSIENTAFVLIDVQGKLSTLMHKKEELFKNIKVMIEGAKALGIPIIWNEQIPDKLGETAPEIKELLTGNNPLVKTTFSCCGNENFINTLQPLNRKQILIAGIETHVCVYQTCIDLLQAGYEVHLLADATSSRTELNYNIALQRIKDEGAKLTTTEMAFFEMLKVAEGDSFKKIIKIIK
ncbi:MAG: hydrolase [candidate division Zixibacteria bacterium]|nr:hydrolase [candidate division Zixibacteria bacterium]